MRSLSAKPCLRYTCKQPDRCSGHQLMHIAVVLAAYDAGHLCPLTYRGCYIAAVAAHHCMPGTSTTSTTRPQAPLGHKHHSTTSTTQHQPGSCWWLSTQHTAHSLKV